MQTSKLTGVVVRGALFGAGLLFAGIALAWTGPLSSPPNCSSGNPGCDAPINVSATSQTKNGTLTISANSGTANLAPSGWGGTFYGTNGVYGQGSSGVGVEGINSNGTTWGGWFQGGYGVYAQGASGQGVYGMSSGSYGVAGRSDASWSGCFGNECVGGAQTAYGVYGNGTNYGAYGHANGNGYGVYGVATAGGGVGVRGDGYSYGLYGTASQGQGIYAVNSSGTNWGGYFVGGYGVYAQNYAGYYGELANGSYSFYGNGNEYLGGFYTGSAYYYSSDARLKTKVEPLSDSLRNVLKLTPVTYEWKDQSRGAGTQLGFIAQDVQAVVPELVHEDPSTGMLSVDYAKVTPLLVGAIQSQQAQLNKQQSEIDELKAEVGALKGR